MAITICKTLYAAIAFLLSLQPSDFFPIIFFSEQLLSA